MDRLPSEMFTRRYFTSFRSYATASKSKQAIPCVRRVWGSSRRGCLVSAPAHCHGPVGPDSLRRAGGAACALGRMSHPTEHQCGRNRTGSGQRLCPGCGEALPGEGEREGREDGDLREEQRGPAPPCWEQLSRVHPQTRAPQASHQG